MATIEFSVSRNQIPAGECATLHWRVDGVKEVYVYAEGERWREHGVVGEGQRQVCPTETTSYYLRAIHRDDSREDRQIVLTVQGGTPVIQHFRVDREEIRKGECVNFRWHVEGVKEVYFHREDIDWRKKGVAGIAEAQRCPNNTSTFCLRVVKRDNSVEQRCITVKVR